MAELLDLTERRPSLTVGIDVSPAYDLLLNLWALQEDDLDTFELGPEWFSSVREAMSADLVGEIDDLSSAHGATWVVLLGLASQAPAPKDLDGFLAWLGAADGIGIRRSLLALKCHDLPQSQLEAAAAGDAEALERILRSPSLADHEAWRSNLASLFETTPTALGPRFASALRRFRDEAFAQAEKEFLLPTERDGAAKSALIPTTSPSRIIEIATNGVEHQLPSHVTTLLLVPSVVVRPWSLLVEHDSTYILCYPVADEFMSAEPDAPPQWLVKTYKALADDRRLRILHRLSSREATLQELADYLGVAKSTIHHHMALLRAAGLVRVRVRGAKDQSSYGIRREALPESMRLMDVYLASAKPIEEVETP